MIGPSSSQTQPPGGPLKHHKSVLMNVADFANAASLAMKEKDIMMMETRWRMMYLIVGMYYCWMVPFRISFHHGHSKNDGPEIFDWFLLLDSVMDSLAAMPVLYHVWKFVQHHRKLQLNQTLTWTQRLKLWLQKSFSKTSSSSITKNKGQQQRSSLRRSTTLSGMLSGFTAGSSNFFDRISSQHSHRFFLRKKKRREALASKVSTTSLTWSSATWICELIAVLPLDRVLFFHQFHYWPCLRLTKLLRVHHIVRHWTHWSRESQSIGILYHPVLSVAFLRLLSLIAILLSACHWSGCGFHLIAMIECPPLSSNQSDDVEECLSWARVDYLVDYPSQIPRAYLRSLYWAMVTLITVGYGDIIPVTSLETVYVCLVELLGAVLCTAIIATYAQLFSALNRAYSSFSTRLENTKYYLTRRKVPQKIQDAVLAYYSYIWASQKGVNERSVLEEVPEHFRTQFLFHLRTKLLVRIRVFQNQKPGFINHLANVLQSHFYSPDQVIIRVYGPLSEIYLISHGQVRVRDSSGRVIVSGAEEDLETTEDNKPPSSSSSNTTPPSGHRASFLSKHAVILPHLMSGSSSSSGGHQKSSTDVVFGVVALFQEGLVYLTKYSVTAQDYVEVYTLGRMELKLSLKKVCPENVDQAWEEMKSAVLGSSGSSEAQPQVSPPPPQSPRGPLVRQPSTVLARQASTSSVTSQNNDNNSSSRPSLVPSRLVRQPSSSSVNNSRDGRLLVRQPSSLLQRQASTSSVTRRSSITSVVSDVDSMFSYGQVSINSNTPSETTKALLIQPLHLYWNHLILMNVLLLGILVPIQFFNIWQDHVFVLMFLTLDGFFLVDLVLQWKYSIAHKGKGQPPPEQPSGDDDAPPVSNLMKAKKHKSQPVLMLRQFGHRMRENQGLILDALALVPLVVVFNFNPILTWLRMLHFHRFFYVLNTSTGRLNAWTQRMVLLVVSVLLIIHWTGSLWFILSRFSNPSSSDRTGDVRDDDDPGQHLSTGGVKPGPDFQTCLFDATHFHNCTWTIHDGLNPILVPIRAGLWMNETSVMHYARSFYWGIVCITTIGYGDIRPFSNAETLFALLAVFFGGCLNYGVVGAVSSVISSINISRDAHQRQMAVMNRYFQIHDISTELRHSVRQYLVYQWTRQKGVNELKLLQVLPFHLQEKICAYLNLENLQSISVFHACPDGFLRLLCTKMRQTVFQTQDVIIRAGDVAEYLCLIKQGLVEIKMPGVTLPIAALETGAYFGEVSFLTNAYHSVHVIACSFCDISMLTKQDFDLAVLKYPEVRSSITAAAAAMSIKYQTLGKAVSRNLQKKKLESHTTDLASFYVSTKRTFRGYVSCASTLYHAWKAYMVLVIVLNTLQLSFRLAFYADLTHDVPTLWSIDICVYASFLLDMYLHLNHFGLEGDDGDDEITDRTVIRSRYLKSSSLKMDVLSALPVFCRPFARETSYLNHVIHCNTLLKCVALPRLTSTLRLKLQERFPSSKLNSVVGLFQLFFILALAAHLAACMLLISVWMWEDTPVQLSYSSSTGGPQELSIGVQYLRAIYWSFSTLTLVVYGDVVPKGLVTTNVAIFICLGGFFVIGQVIGQLTSLILTLDKEAFEFQRRKDEFNQYAMVNDLPSHLITRAHAFLTFQYESSKDVDSRDLIQTLPPSLRAQLGMTLYADLILDHREGVFQPIANQLDRVQAVVAKLRPQFFLPREEMIVEGTLGRCLYLMRKGQAEVRIAQAQIVVAALEDGAVFGELAFFIPNQLTMASVHSTTFCETMVMDRPKWHAIFVLGQSPSIRKLHDDMTLQAIDRLERIRHRHVSIERNFKVAYEVRDSMRLRAYPEGSQVISRRGKLLRWMQLPRGARSTYEDQQQVLRQMNMSHQMLGRSSSSISMSVVQKRKTNSALKKHNRVMPAPESQSESAPSVPTGPEPGVQDVEVSQKAEVSSSNSNSSSVERQRASSFSDVQPMNNNNNDAPHHDIQGVDLRRTASDPELSTLCSKEKLHDAQLYLFQDETLTELNSKKKKERISSSSNTLSKSRSNVDLTKQWKHDLNDDDHEEDRSKLKKSPRVQQPEAVGSSTDPSSLHNSSRIMKRRKSSLNILQDSKSNHHVSNNNNPRTTSSALSSTTHTTTSSSFTMGYLSIWSHQTLPPDYTMPESNFRQVWNIGLFVITLYYTFMTPFRLAFMYDTLGDEASSSFHWCLAALEVLMDLYCWTDLALHRLVFMEWSEGQVISSRHVYAHYRLDVLSVFPFDLFFLPLYLCQHFQTTTSVFQYLAWSRVNRVLRVRTFPRMMQKMELFVLHTLGVDIPVSTWRFMTLLFYFVLSGHGIASLWYLVGMSSSSSSNDDTNHEGVSWISHDAILSRVQGPTDSEHRSSSPTAEMVAVAYLRSLYFALTSITTVGYGDIVSTTVWETVCQLGVIVASVSLFGSLVAAQDIRIDRLDGAKVTFEGRMKKIIDFLQCRDLPPNLTTQICAYYVCVWQRQEGLDEHLALDRFPLTLHHDIIMYVRRDLATELSIFRKCDRSIANAIIVVLKPEVYLAHTVIVAEGDIWRNMYFIKTGSVEIYNNDKTVRMVKYKGDHFGELSLLFDVTRSANCETREFCEIYVLEYQAFERIMREYPSYREKVEQQFLCPNWELKKTRFNLDAKANKVLSRKRSQILMAVARSKVIATWKAQTKAGASSSTLDRDEE